eukprot:gene4735-5790_t
MEAQTFIELSPNPLESCQMLGELLQRSVRTQLVAKILKRVRELAGAQNKDIGYTVKSIFDGIVGTRQWVPSDPKRAETQIQWKRSGNGGVTTLYAIFTSEAYDILAAEQSRGPEGAASLRREELLRKAAEDAINRVESKANEVFERAKDTIGKNQSIGTTAIPETKKLLKRIDAKLGDLNEQTKESADAMEQLQIKHDENAERRHRELSEGVNSFHRSYEATGTAMVTAIEAVTNRLLETQRGQWDRQPQPPARQPASPDQQRPQAAYTIPKTKTKT